MRAGRWRSRVVTFAWNFLSSRCRCADPQCQRTSPPALNEASRSRDARLLREREIFEMTPAASVAPCRRVKKHWRPDSYSVEDHSTRLEQLCRARATSAPSASHRPDDRYKTWRRTPTLPGAATRTENPGTLSISGRLCYHGELQAPALGARSLGIRPRA